MLLWRSDNTQGSVSYAQFNVSCPSAKRIIPGRGPRKTHNARYGRKPDAGLTGQANSLPFRYSWDMLHGDDCHGLGCHPKPTHQYYSQVSICSPRGLFSNPGTHETPARYSTCSGYGPPVPHDSYFD